MEHRPERIEIDDGPQRDDEHEQQYARERDHRGLRREAKELPLFGLSLKSDQ